MLPKQTIFLKVLKLKSSEIKNKIPEKFENGFIFTAPKTATEPFTSKIVYAESNQCVDTDT